MSDAERPGPRAGGTIQDLCRACKTVRTHTIIAVGQGGEAARVLCDVCGSQHNYRHGGGATREPAFVAPPRLAAGSLGPRTTGPAPERPEPAPERERTVSTVTTTPAEDELEHLLRRVIREECGLSTVAPADKWRGGELVLRPGKPGLQEKRWPIDAFFHKIVMIRNRLRALEQQVNASELPEDAKLRLQAYVTGCYGSLTSFNALFASEDDQFQGSGGGD